MPIKHLKIKNFRNHTDLDITSNAKFININGENGVGKTNILEAISMFAPGRGIRNAHYEDMLCNNSAEGFWFARCDINSTNDENQLSTSFQPNESAKRSIKVNETIVGSATTFLTYMRVIWLTPKLDSIFGESSTLRRKFFDRICYNVYPQHASDVNKLESAIRSRNKLIKDNYSDPSWLSAYEKIIAEQSLIIAKTRRYILSQLQEILTGFTSGFLKPIIELDCLINQCLEEMDNSTVISTLLSLQEEAREKDRYRGRCSIGAHRTEFVIKHPTKGALASFCSTGEQKAMVISTLIAQIKCIETNFDGTMVLLLDDIFSHLDNARKSELVDELDMTRAQIWLTSADTFDPLFKRKDNVKILI